MVAPSGGDTLVWYVAYGSNLAADRLRVYLEGGLPEGGQRHYAGSRDPSPPRDDCSTRVPFPLYFASRSRTWGGGIAFVDPAPAPETETLARAWLVTRVQLEDIVAQERDAPLEAIDVDAVTRDGVATLGDGRYYGTLVACGTIREIPAVTCTAPVVGPEGPVVSAPTPPYLRTVARGLREAHGLDVPATTRYLAGIPGVVGTWDPDELTAALE